MLNHFLYHLSPKRKYFRPFYDINKRSILSKSGHLILNTLSLFWCSVFFFRLMLENSWSACMFLHVFKSHVRKTSESILAHRTEIGGRLSRRKGLRTFSCHPLADQVATNWGVNLFSPCNGSGSKVKVFFYFFFGNTINNKKIIDIDIFFMKYILEWKILFECFPYFFIFFKKLYFCSSDPLSDQIATNWGWIFFHPVSEVNWK